MRDPDAPRQVQQTGTAATILALALLQAADTVRPASPRAARVLMAGACLYLAMFSAVAWSREERRRH